MIVCFNTIIPNGSGTFGKKRLTNQWDGPEENVDYSEKVVPHWVDWGERFPVGVNYIQHIVLNHIEEWGSSWIAPYHLDFGLSVGERAWIHRDDDFANLTSCQSVKWVTIVSSFKNADRPDQECCCVQCYLYQMRATFCWTAAESDAYLYCRPPHSPCRVSFGITTVLSSGWGCNVRQILLQEIRLVYIFPHIDQHFLWHVYFIFLQLYPIIGRLSHFWSRRYYHGGEQNYPKKESPHSRLCSGLHFINVCRNVF